MEKTFICKQCKRKRKHRAKGLCNACYVKNTHVYVMGFNKKPFSVYTNGVTKELQSLVPKIKNDVLEDCIKNPRKYLD